MLLLNDEHICTMHDKRSDTDDTTPPTNRTRRGVLRTLGVSAATVAAVGTPSAAQSDPGTDDDRPLGDPASEATRADAQPDTNPDADSTGQLTRVTLRDQETDGTSATVRFAHLAEGGYLSIHDARTRLYDDAPVEQRVLESLIGITDLFAPGSYRNVAVPLFESPAPAVDQFGRSGPLEESQPLIAIPHINAEETGDTFEFTFADQNDPSAGLAGDRAYFADDDGGVAILDLDAVNDIAAVFLEGASREERGVASQETTQARADF